MKEDHRNYRRNVASITAMIFFSFSSPRSCHICFSNIHNFKNKYIYLGLEKLPWTGHGPRDTVSVNKQDSSIQKRVTNTKRRLNTTQI